MPEIRSSSFSGSCPSNRNFLAAPNASRLGLNGPVIALNLTPVQRMEDRILNHFPPFQVLDHNAFQKRRRDVGIPYSIRVNDDDRASSAHPKAGCFSALD